MNPMNLESFTTAQIDLEAVRHNIGEIKRLLPPSTKFMAVVKADGYGHGSVQVSRAAISSGADYLGVASLREALELRNAGIVSPILILSESDPKLAEEIVKHRLSQTVYTEALISALSKASVSLGKTAVVHLKIDTGMGRIGARPDEAVEIIKVVRNLPGLEFEGVFTHFAKADDLNNDYTRKQLSIFNDLIRASSGLIDFKIRHAANSAATLYFPDSHLDMVRVGLSMYGLYPGPDKNNVALKPALSFKTKVVYLKRVKKGSALSYGGTYRTKKETTIATIPVGYADGYSRGLSNKGKVLIGGKKFPVVGRVCMDLTLVEMGDETCLTGRQGCEMGDEVVLIGTQGRETISADDIAKALNTINYEVVCGIGKRVPRVYNSV
jgi:alanine racemase